MRFDNVARAAGRLAVMTDKSGAELQAFLTKWFEKHFVKGLSLSLLRSMHGSEAFDAFLTFIENGGEAVTIAVVRKLDPHRPDVMRRSHAEMIEHIVELATLRVEPAGKPKAAAKSKKAKSQALSVGGVAERTRL